MRNTVLITARLDTKTPNGRGRTFKNAGDAVDDQDLVTLHQVRGLIPTAIAKVAGNTTIVQGGSSSPTWKVLSIATNAITPDLQYGKTFKVILNQATQITVNVPIFTGGTITNGLEFKLLVFQDATGGRPTPLFSTSTHGFGPDALYTPSSSVVRSLDETASHYSVYDFMYFDDGIWHLIRDVTTGLKPL